MFVLVLGFLLGLYGGGSFAVLVVKDKMSQVKVSNVLDTDSTVVFVTCSF